MLINVVTKRTSNGEFIGYNILLHYDRDDKEYLVKTKLNLFDDIDLYVGATKSQFKNFVPVVRYLKENLDILSTTEGKIEGCFDELIAVMLGEEFHCTARAGKD